MALALWLVALPTISAPPAARAADLRRDASVAALLTHKGGFAAGKAHNHLIAAPLVGLTLELDPERPLETRFHLQARVAELVVDADAPRQALQERLQALGLIDEPYKALDDDERQKIRETMLSKKQLDGASFPDLEVKLVGLEEKETKIGNATYPYGGAVEITVHGKTVKRAFGARLDHAEGDWVVEALAEAAFTDFGIKPYSAFLGAVKNLDPIHFYLRLVLSGSGGSP